MDISLMIEGQMGLNWKKLELIAGACERLGYFGLYRSDHFTNPSPPDSDSLELIVSLTWLAANTSRIRFGQLVSPVSFRDPIMTARQAAHLSDLGRGRMILGLGAGWQEREHEMFGYSLGDIRTRMDRLEEALAVTHALLRSDGPVTFQGRYFTVKEAMILPRADGAASPRILVGGNGAVRTPRLAARYADIYNCTHTTAEQFSKKCALLDELLLDSGREPGSLKRTLMTGVQLARSGAELERRLEVYRRNPAYRDKPTKELVQMLRERGILVGTAEEIRAQCDLLESAGAQELMLQWLDLDDLEGIAGLADALLGSRSGGGGI